MAQCETACQFIDHGVSIHCFMPRIFGRDVRQYAGANRVEATDGDRGRAGLRGKAI